MANEPAPAAAAGADQVRLSRLTFPTFDGKDNYRNWKKEFDILIALVPQEEVKRSRLLEALTGDAKIYIKSVITPEKTYNDVVALLQARYNDPLVINYNLLDKMFNNPEMANPQSTQKHWDNAVGDINAVIASGMTIDEILVYYKLHKFQPETVRRVKMLHNIKYPGRHSINLEEAVALMNKVTAEEVELTKDSVAIEQTMQGLTMTAVPKVSPVPAQPLNNLPPNTSQTQNGGNKNRYKGKWSTNNYSNKCKYCNNKDHHSSKCTKFTTPQERRQALVNNGKCQECTAPKQEGITHKCDPNINCSICNGTHLFYLCPKTTPSNK